VKLLEKAWELISALITGGPAALWEKIKEFLGNLKEMVIDALQNWVVETVIKSAITKLATMFNPVGAIVQAIITIYNTVMFFIERINQILDLVEAIVNSVYKIAVGDIGSAANWVEQALARTIPVIIGFLARLLGLGGLSDKIKSVIQKIQATVDRAIDKLIEKIVAGIGKLLGKGASGPAAGHDAELNTGLQALDKVNAKYENQEATKEALDQDVIAVKGQHPVFKSLGVTESESGFVYDYSASPGKTKTGPGAGKVHIVLDRPGHWWSSTREALRKRFPTRHLSGQRPLLKAGEARRHAIASATLIAHYYEVLNNNVTLHQARALLEAKQNEEITIVVRKPLTNKAIQEAAARLFRAAYNFSENLWVGDALANSTKQDEDDFPPWWTAEERAAKRKKLEDLFFLKR
jgi:hypothetical protein